MTLQFFSPTLLAPALDGHRRSLWSRLIDALAASQQRKAEQVVRDYLQRHLDEHRDDCIRELERRFLGQ
jgi:hypothetical protein